MRARERDRRAVFTRRELHEKQAHWRGAHESRELTGDGVRTSLTQVVLSTIRERKCRRKRIEGRELERESPATTEVIAGLALMVEEGFEPSKTGVDRFTVCCR